MPKIIFETQNALGIATLNNPPVNAIGLELVEDLQNGVASFLKDGPGKITFEGK